MGAASTILWADAPGWSRKPNISIFCKDFCHRMACLRNYGCAITRMSTKIEKTTSRAVKMSSWENCGWISLVYLIARASAWCLCAFEDEKCKNFWKCRNAWRWWREERKTQTSVLPLAEISRCQVWCWPHLGENPAFLAMFSAFPEPLLPYWHFSTPFSPSLCSLCCVLFWGRVLASLPCEPTKQFFFFHFYWLVFTPVSPH